MNDEFKSETDEPRTHLFMSICCEGCGHQIDVPVYCGNRFCTVCGVARRMRVRNRLEFLVKNIDQPTDMSMKFLTLTIPSQTDVHGMTRSILRSFRKLRQRAFWKQNVSGGAFVVEIKGRPKYWHVHIHIVLMCKYMPFKDLMVQWLSCSKGRGVWIEEIPTEAVVDYLTKYLTKPSVPDDQIADVNTALKGLRLFSPFGSWYSLNNTYEKPKADCPKCQCSFWMPFDLVYSDHIKHYEMEVDLPPPRCLLTSELDLA